MKQLIFATLIFVSAVALTPAAHAQNLGFNVSRHVCGKYTFDVTRVVDGFQIRVADGVRTRMTFYPDVYQNQTPYFRSSSIISGCYGNDLAISKKGIAKYYSNQTINLIDPTGTYLQTKTLASRDNFASPPVTTPLSASSTMDTLLSQPTDPWSITRPGLVSKQRIAPELPSILNDKSYFVFNNKGGITRKTAASNWSTTFAQGSTICNGNVSYVVYAKKFADADSSTSTFPAVQYIVERSTPGSRKLIPVPYADGAWRDPMKSITAYFGSCFGENVGFFTNYTNVSMLSGKTAFVNYLNPKKSINTLNSIFETATGYYQPGLVWSQTDSSGRVTYNGDATIRILNSTGTVTTRKPLFFQDIHSYPVWTNMEFRLDPKDPAAVDVVRLLQPTNDSSNPVTISYFQAMSGTYQAVTRDEYTDWKPPVYQWQDATPLYLSADKGALTVRSYFLTQSMLLHNFPNTQYTLLWNRIGPLEQDGTRKIWYAFKSNGVTQTLLARVR